MYYILLANLRFAWYEQKMKVISVRLDDITLSKISESKVRRSEIVRRALQSYLTGDKYLLSREMSLALRDMRIEITRIGGNLNQIARQLNMSTIGSLSAEQQRQLIYAHTELGNQIVLLKKTILCIEKEIS